MRHPGLLLRALFAIGSACAIVLIVAGSASAHAILDSATPADGAQVATAPTEVTLEFSEDVSAAVGAVRVLNSDGARVDTGKPQVTGHVVRVTLKSFLPDGPYIVTWRVISADAHTASGALTFAVGAGAGAVADDAAIAAAFAEGSDDSVQIAAAVARAMAYIGALLAAGGALFLALAHEEGPSPIKVRRVISVAAVLAVAGVLLALVLHADLETGFGLGSVFQSAARADALDDGVGLSTGITLVGLVALLGALRITGPAGRPLLAVAALIAGGGFAAAGHTTQVTPMWPMSIADVVHVAGGAAWFGGLIVLGLTLRGRGDHDPAVAARVVGHVSALATAAILAVGATGVALAWKQVGSLGALTSTSYGKLLLLKVAVVAAVAATGAYNHFVLVPAVVGGGAREAVWRRLRRTVGVEGAGIVCVLLVTAVLVNVVPSATQVTGSFATTTPFGSGSAQVIVDPARTGPTSVHIYLLDSAGRPLTSADGGPLSVTLELSLSAANVGPIERTPLRAGPGHFQLNGDDFSIAGRWQILLRARLSKLQDTAATIEVPIRP